MSNSRSGGSAMMMPREESRETSADAAPCTPLSLDSGRDAAPRRG